MNLLNVYNYIIKNEDLEEFEYYLIEKEDYIFYIPTDDIGKLKKEKENIYFLNTNITIYYIDFYLYKFITNNQTVEESIYEKNDIMTKNISLYNKKIIINLVNNYRNINMDYGYLTNVLKRYNLKALKDIFDIVNMYSRYKIQRRTLALMLIESGKDNDILNKLKQLNFFKQEIRNKIYIGSENVIQIDINVNPSSKLTIHINSAILLLDIILNNKININTVNLILHKKSPSHNNLDYILFNSTIIDMVNKFMFSKSTLNIISKDNFDDKYIELKKIKIKCNKLVINSKNSIDFLLKNIEFKELEFIMPYKTNNIDILKVIDEKAYNTQIKVPCELAKIYTPKNKTNKYYLDIELGVNIKYIYKCKYSIKDKNYILLMYI